MDTLTWEREVGKTLSPLEIFKGKTTRRRLMIGASPGVITSSTGNIIGASSLGSAGAGVVVLTLAASYYLGDELNSAGVTSSLAQLKANVVLNVWCLACAVAGTQLLVRWGRKPSALACQFSLIVLLYIIGGLSKVYADHTAAGVASSNALVYGNVAAIFLFQGAYSCVAPGIVSKLTPATACATLPSLTSTRRRL